MMKDVGTGFRDFVAMDSKSAENHTQAFLNFVGKRHGRNLGTVHSDGAHELKKSVSDLQAEYKWVHSVACPHRETERGKVEREIGTVLGATRCNLEQSGLPLSWWPRAARYTSFALNVNRRHVV